MLGLRQGLNKHSREMFKNKTNNLQAFHQTIKHFFKIQTIAQMPQMEQRQRSVQRARCMCNELVAQNRVSPKKLETIRNYTFLEKMKNQYANTQKKFDVLKTFSAACYK